MLTHNLRIRNCLITFLLLSLASFFDTLDNGIVFGGGLGAALAWAGLAACAEPPSDLAGGLPPFFGALFEKILKF